MGLKKLIDYDFPKTWNKLKDFDDQNINLNIDKISETGYDSINYFIKNYYSLLFDSITLNKKMKLEFIPKINSYQSKYSKIDSCYYGKTIFETEKYVLKLYKNGNEYDKLSGSENLSIIKYLLLVTFDKQNNIKDYLTIYYNNNSLYEYNDKYFYIDKNKNITLKYFHSDELESQFLGEEKWNLNSEGKFIQKSGNVDPSLKNYPTGIVKDSTVPVSKFTKKDNWNGSFYIKTQIISDATKQITDIEYFIFIKDNYAILSIGAEHSKDKWCQGDYSLEKRDGFIYAKGKCDQDDVNDFSIKMENDNYYIQSKFFINKGWQQLEIRI
jgi:hypothetical protein